MLSDITFEISSNATSHWQEILLLTGRHRRQNSESRAMKNTMLRIYNFVLAGSLSHASEIRQIETVQTAHFERLRIRPASINNPRSLTGRYCSWDFPKRGSEFLSEHAGIAVSDVVGVTRTSLVYRSQCHGDAEATVAIAVHVTGHRQANRRAYG